MTVSEWITKSTARLEKAGIGTSRLDCLVLLEDVVSKNRAFLLAHPETVLNVSQQKKLDLSIRRRSNHEPLAYIRGKTEFYGRDFMINHAVLEPRPESETMLELLVSLKKVPQTIIDLGTGSGALAITAKLEIPDTKVLAVDLDPACLQVARQNAKRHKASIKFYEGNLVEPIEDIIATEDSLILANLPYVPDRYVINQAAAQEPRLAIFGGSDGLDVYRALFRQLNRGDGRVKFVFTESLPFQHKDLSELAKNHGFRQANETDFIQVFQKS